MSGFQKVKFLPVAGHAKKGEPNRKMLKRLERRLRDYAAMRADTKHENKVGARIDAGGYHRPGSMK